jgi:parallel beta-helix repeat protein
MIQRLMIVLVAVIILLSIPLTAQCKVIYVKTAGSDTNNGSSWALAKKTVQAGLNAASGTTSDEVWVSAGTYLQTISLKVGVKLYGGFTGSETDISQRDWMANQTILDGNQAGKVVTSPSGATATTRIDGFIIRNGSMGGVYCAGSSPVIANNIIVGNGSPSGGGIYCNGSSPVIINNIIKHNCASNQGGGLYCSGSTSSPVITNNTITENTAFYGGGGLYFSSSATVSNNIIAFNSSGIFRAGTVGTLRNNDLYGNISYNYSGVSAGEGDISSDPVIVNVDYTSGHIRSDSPCVNVGWNDAPGLLTVDIDGQVRIQAETVDIGADESDGTDPSSGEWVPATIIRVSPNGNDSNDGLSWAAAKRTVQAGINAASYGGDVWVKAATYLERITLKNGVALLGGFAGSETNRSQRDCRANAVILDGSQGGTVVVSTSAAALTSIDGFTIQNGKATNGGGIRCTSLVIANNIIKGNTAASSGGGIYCSEYSFTTIDDNTIIGNNGGGAGGIYCSDYSFITIKNNKINNNSTTGSGAGIFCSDGEGPVGSVENIAGNTISGNSASYYGGGIYAGTSTNIMDNVITANKANYLGSGIFCGYHSSAKITGNVIRANLDGICCDMDSSPIIAGNAIVGNQVNGILSSHSSATITNNTIVGNGQPWDSPMVGSGILTYGSLATITSNIIAFNCCGVYNDGTGVPAFHNNLVYGNGWQDYSGFSPDTSNISVDPRFIGLEYGNVHLKADSPCINAGLNDAVGLPATDIDGQDRIQDETVDIGADEFDGTEPVIDPCIIRVSRNGNDLNDGSSWTTPKRTIQAGIYAVSAYGGEVWVKWGSFGERITLPPYVYLYGGFAGYELNKSDRNWNWNTSTIDGVGTCPVVTILPTATATVLSCVDGFTIQNGFVPLQTTNMKYGGGIYCAHNSARITNNTIRLNGSETVLGGGIGCYYSSPEIRNNTIEGNTASSGGGIYCEYSSPTIEENTINGNSTVGSGMYPRGGGISCWYASPRISNNTITENTAMWGGGIDCLQNCSPVIENNTIAGNHVDGNGGGISSSLSSPTIRANTITENEAYNGGGMQCDADTSIVTGNVFAGNTASFGGAGILCQMSEAKITNNTLVGNNAPSNRGAIYCTLSDSPSIANNIVSFGLSGIACDGQSTPILSSNNVYGNGDGDYSIISPGTGDISLDPLFVDKANGDYHLSIFSPCINAGSNDAPSLPATDIDGEARIQGSTVDIGADECWLKAGSLRDAKKVVNDILIDIDGVPVTAAFPDYFYIENPDRSNGIRVDRLAHGLSERVKARVIGSIKTSPSGERYIDGTTADPAGDGTVAPLLLTNRSLGGDAFGLQTGVLGGFGLNNIGLLIKTFGKVTFVGDGYFYIDDGSRLNDDNGNLGVKVYGTVPVEENEDPIGKFVTVTGISSCEKPSTDPIRVIRTRRSGDVVVIP